MIKDITTELKKKPKAFIKEFINNCTIEEKIDAYYVSVEIVSKNSIKIRKSNNKEIDRVDLILNNMWGHLITNWNYIRISNQEWFNKHIGYKIYMFFFPIPKPISIEYNDNIQYLIDRITFNDELVNKYEFVNGLNDDTIIRFDIQIKDYLGKIQDIEFPDNIKELDSTFFINLIDKNNIYTKIYAKNLPEGYIYKWKNNIYQLTFHTPEIIKSQRSSYEFLLCDFIKYCKSSNYIDKITQKYVKTICNLFNDYILNHESKTHNIEYNINVDDIKNPYLGTYFDIGLEYIPDNVTANLCNENELYKNIFKVLLANLRKGKDKSKCIYMNEKQVDDWNIIMKNIKLRALEN